MLKKLLVLVLLSCNTLRATTTTTVLHSSADAFVYNPGTGATWTKALAAYDYGAGNNFGSSGSMSVASATAPQQKGEFDTLLKYDLSSLTGYTVTSLTLTVNLSKGNTGGNSIFYTTGNAGNFDISWFSSSWNEGVDGPHTGTYTGGITYNSLRAMLTTAPANYLETFYFDNIAGSHLLTLNITGSNYSNLLSAISAGDTITLLLTPSAGSNTDFNITGNNNAYLTITATIPEPVTLLILAAGSIFIRRNKQCLK